MGRNRAVTDAHGGDACERRLQSRQKLALELGIDVVARIGLLDIAAYVLVEKHRIHDAIRILAVAAHRYIHVKADIGIDHAERYGRGGAVLVAHDLLLIEEVDALVFAGIAAEGETRADALEGLQEAIAQTVLPEEERRFGRFVENELTRLAAGIYDGSLLDDDHELAFVDRDDRTVGDDIALALGIGAAPAIGYPLDAFRRQHIGGKRIAIEELAPGIGEHAAQRPSACLQKSHVIPPFS